MDGALHAIVKTGAPWVHRYSEDEIDGTAVLRRTASYAKALLAPTIIERLTAIAESVPIPWSVCSSLQSSPRAVSLRLQTNSNLLPLLLLTALLLYAHRTFAATLPDAPQAAMPPSQIATRYAPRLAKYIQPGQRAQPLTTRDKLELAGWEQVQPYAFGTEILAAAWQHLLDSDPRYGTDRAGFGERLGAAVLQHSSQAVFSDGVLPALLHQDPRYYRMGSGGIVKRIVYAATRVLATRTDAGAEAPNYSLFLGHAAASALTVTYYPAVSATWNATLEGYVTSFGTAALGNQIHEFAPDLIIRLRRWHHKHPR